MKFLIAALLLLSLSLFTRGQEKVYKLDEYFEITANKNYAYDRLIKKDDTVWICSDYNRKGKLAQLAHFKDENLKFRTGLYVYYVNEKKLYEGYYKNNKPAGIWYFYEPAGVLADSLNYEFYAAKPALPQLLTKKEIVVKDSSAYNKKDTAGAFARVEIEAMFPGGTQGWRKYLVDNLLPKKGVPDLIYSQVNKGTVQVRFVVCNDGQICNVETLNSVHPLVDWYAVRTIRKGPSWVPGEQNNRKVKSYHTQPITFFFPGE